VAGGLDAGRAGASPAPATDCATRSPPRLHGRAEGSVGRLPSRSPCSLASQGHCSPAGAGEALRALHPLRSELPSQQSPGQFTRSQKPETKPKKISRGCTRPVSRYPRRLAGTLGHNNMVQTAIAAMPTSGGGPTRRSLRLDEDVGSDVLFLVSGLATNTRHCRGAQTSPGTAGGGFRIRTWRVLVQAPDL